MTPRIAIQVGQTFGRLTVIAPPIYGQPNGITRVLCRCQCGTERTFRCDHLRSGRSRSCGCLHDDWISAQEVKIEAFGETLTQKQWSARTGIKVSTLRMRLQAGWTPERALTQKVRGATDV